MEANSDVFSPVPSPNGHFAKSPADVSISVSDWKKQWIAVPPILAVSRKSKNRWITTGVFDRVENLNFSTINFSITEKSISTTTDGITPVLKNFEGQTPLHSLKNYITALENHGIIPKNFVPKATKMTIFCGWGEQTKKNPENPSELSNQEFYDYLVSKLKETGLWQKITTIIIDDKWQECYSHLTPDKSKWKDMKRWIKRIHDENKMVFLWFKLWDSEGATPNETDNLSGKILPESQDYQKRLAEELNYLLNDLNIDGLKLDYLALTPAKTTSKRKGIALLHHYLDFIYTTVKKLKPGALIESISPSPHFRGTFDICRLNDITPQMQGKVAELMMWRFIVSKLALGKMFPIDSDDWDYPSEEDKRTYRLRRKKWGMIESFYFVC